MELVVGVLMVVCAVHAIGRAAARDRKRAAPRREEWSPYDGFYSDRPHWRPPEK